MTDDDRLVQAARRLSATLTPGDLDHVLHRITAAAVELLPDVDYASITVQRSDGTLHTVAPTDDLVRDLDAMQYERKEGPCYEAAANDLHVTSQDLSQDERFPGYGPAAGEGGLRLLNPGSPTDRRRQPHHTYMTAAITGGELRDVELHRLPPRR